MLEQADEAAEGRGGDGVIEHVERVAGGDRVVAAGHGGFPSFGAMNSYTRLAFAGATGLGKRRDFPTASEHLWSRVSRHASDRGESWRRSDPREIGRAACREREE